MNGLRNGFEHVDPEMEEARGAFEAATLEKNP